MLASTKGLIILATLISRVFKLLVIRLLLWEIDKYRKESNHIEGKYCPEGFTLSSEDKENHLSESEIKKNIQEIPRN